jgi:hypothetical protein
MTNLSKIPRKEIAGANAPFWRIAIGSEAEDNK